MKKPTKVFVIEYRYWDRDINQWITKISQEVYSSYDDAVKFCKERAHNDGVTENPMYFQNITFNGIHEEYFIHEVIIK